MARRLVFGVGDLAMTPQGPCEDAQETLPGTGYPTSPLYLTSIWMIALCLRATLFYDLSEQPGSRAALSIFS